MKRILFFCAVLLAPMASYAAVEAVDYEDEQRRQRDCDQSEEGTAKSIGQIPEADHPQPSWPRADLPDGERLRELAVSRPPARHELRIDNRNVP